MDDADKGLETSVESLSNWIWGANCSSNLKGIYTVRNTSSIKISAKLARS